MITGIILAGGESKRFGGEKGLALLHGKPLIEWVIAALRPLCSDILISANSASYNAYPYRVIPDVSPGKGPMMGIYSGLANSGTMHNLVLSVDTPLVSAALLHYIFENAGDTMIAVPQMAPQHFEPLIGYYQRDAISSMETFFAQHNYKLPELFRSLPFRGIDLQAWPLFQPIFLANVNTREDLDALQNRE